MKNIRGHLEGGHCGGGSGGVRLCDVKMSLLQHIQAAQQRPGAVESFTLLDMHSTALKVITM